MKSKGESVSNAHMMVDNLIYFTVISESADYFLTNIKDLEALKL